VDIRGKKMVVIGGAGLIGSHTVDQLTAQDVREILIYGRRGSARGAEPPDYLAQQSYFRS